MYLKKFQILCVLISLIARKERREVRVSDRWMFLYHWENKETVDLIGNVPHKPVLTCATVVSFPIARSERKTCLPRFCLHSLRISQAFCSPLVIGQETTAVKANQHKQNYLTVCFCCSSFIVFQQHFRCPGLKESTPLIKLGLQPLVHVRTLTSR